MQPENVTEILQSYGWRRDKFTALGTLNCLQVDQGVNPHTALSLTLLFCHCGLVMFIFDWNLGDKSHSKEHLKKKKKHFDLLFN